MTEVLAESTDLLLEPPRDIRCRFLEEFSLSSKGLGRVEQGSEEVARSRDSSAGSWSIWQIPKASKEFGESQGIAVAPRKKAQKLPEPRDNGIRYRNSYPMRL